MEGGLIARSNSLRVSGTFFLNGRCKMKLQKPEVRMVAVDSLVVDASYQREAIAAHVAGITKHFDPEAFGTITAAERDDGSLHPVDGFQRYTVACSLGAKTVPCQIIKSRGPEHEAELFGKLNKRRGLNTHQLFKAEVRAGKPEAVAVYEAVTVAGLNVYGMPSNGKRHSIKGIKQCINAFRRSGGGDAGSAHVTEVLKMLRFVWGTLHRDTAYHCAVIGGLAYFLRRFGARVDRKRLTDRMERLTPNKLMGHGDAIKMMSGTTRDEGVARAFFEVYNKGMRKYALDWDQDRDIGQRATDEVAA